MGQDQSKLNGLLVDEKAVEVTDFWSLFNAEVPNDDGATRLSIFKGEPLVSGQLWVLQSPLERAIKNLMIYRHPSILKYVTSWERGSQKHLATERCRPLSLVVQTQSDIQICLGLRNVLCSLIFLVEQAKARHLNVCTSSIYVNSEGDWRLGGFEYVWKSKDVTKGLLEQSKPYRYNKALDPHESRSDGHYIEQYSMAVLCEDILRNSKSLNTPYVQEFRDYCATHLKHQNVAMRPKLSAILLHPYFNHEFVLIHSFLMELPLKNLQEKQDFFTGLIDRLRYFDEEVVASQVGGLLLSRMVLLDATAQLCVTPYVLKIKNDISSALFSGSTFTKYIIPKIKQIFCVRDAQIRLILLEYFNEYMRLVTKEELQEQILPNLLLGIKDTNDILVAKTLRCLADLVPILGSANVIGGNRGRLFADGRPQGLPDSAKHWVEPRSITPVMACGELMVSASPLPDNVDMSESYVSMGNTDNLLMHERLSPDGGEDVQATTDGELEEDAWSDWENEETHIPAGLEENAERDDAQPSESFPPVEETYQSVGTTPATPKTPTTPTKTTAATQLTSTAKTKPAITAGAPAAVFDDIRELDIKNQKCTKSQMDEIDFFKDMEPVIEKVSLSTAAVSLVDEKSSTGLDNDGGVKRDAKEVNKSTLEENVTVDASRFQIKVADDMCEAGWDDATNDWGDD